MTVLGSAAPVSYVGDNTLATYSYPFPIQKASDIVVRKTDLTPTTTVLVLNTDYTVTGAGTSTGGTITLLAGNLPTGFGLSITRTIPLTQETDLRNQGLYFPEVHEAALDRAVMMIQALSTPPAPGNVIGPSVSVDNEIARFDQTTGKLLQGTPTGAPTISDSGVATIPQGIVLGGLGVANGQAELKGFTSGTATVRAAAVAGIPVLTLSTQSGVLPSAPATTVDNSIARFDGPTGQAIQGYTSGAPTIDDVGNFIIPKEVAHLGNFRHSSLTLFASLDATPDVSTSFLCKTANAGATIITDFDGAAEGHEILVRIGDANTTVDFTGTNLKGNNGVDWVPAVGDFLRAVRSESLWYCSVHKI